MDFWWQKICVGLSIHKVMEDRVQREICVRAVAKLAALLLSLLFLHYLVELISIRRAIEIEIVVANNHGL